MSIRKSSQEPLNPNDLQKNCMHSKDSKWMKSGSPDLNWVPKRGSMFNNQLLGLQFEKKKLKLVNFDQDNMLIIDVGTCIDA